MNAFKIVYYLRTRFLQALFGLVLIPEIDFKILILFYSNLK